MEIIEKIFGSTKEENVSVESTPQTTAIIETKDMPSETKIIDGKKWVCTLVDEVDAVQKETPTPNV